MKDDSIIYVDNGIFNRSEPKGFHPTGYKINVSHPTVNRLYNNYKANHGIIFHEPVSTADRLHFEEIIFKMIETGKLVVLDG
jgi:hypothetical protein